MSINNKQIRRGFLSLLAATFISGCANTQQSNLYLLHSPEKIAAISDEVQLIEGKHIAVERLRIPKYLERPTIITTANESELIYSEFRRWASPLESNLSEVLVMNLGTLLPKCVVLSSRAMVPAPPDYQLHVQIQRMSGELGKNAILQARWGIFANNNDIKHYVKGGASTFKSELEGDDYDTYVQALNKLIVELSTEIAKDLSEIPEEPQEVSEQ